MTLGELIEALEAEPKDKLVFHGFNNPHSYRGYYNDLAFEPAQDITVGEMLEAARSAVGKTFTGYKGGDFKMDTYTDVWLSEDGYASGETIGPTLLKFMLNNAA